MKQLYLALCLHSPAKGDALLDVSQVGCKGDKNKVVQEGGVNVGWRRH